MSSQSAGTEVTLSAINGSDDGDGGIAHGARLIAFTDAAMSDDEAGLVRQRSALRDVLSPAAFVDTCATIAAFNVVDRIADATGIPLDDSLIAISAEVRDELDLGRFSASANTPGL